MKRIIYTIMFLLFFIQINFAGEKKRFYQMSNQEIDSLITVVAQKSMTVTEKMNFFSQFFLGTDYSFTCVGDGKDAILETYPLVNFKQTNCMALCEHVLALSISDNWDNFFNNLQQIRYKQGMIGMRTRNHYTMADWLPENRWLLEDVSDKIGGSGSQKVTRTISHIKFFKNKGISDLRHVIKDRKITINYIPSVDLNKIKDKLQTGDIGAILYANKTDIFSAHMFMIAESENKLIIREASTSKMSTFDTNYEKWTEKIKGSNRYIGITIMRVREEINQQGSIILPWEIEKIKTGLVK